MDKEDVAPVYNGILLSHKKERIWVSSGEVNEPRVCYTEWSQVRKRKNKYRILMHIYGVWENGAKKSICWEGMGMRM